MLTSHRSWPWFVKASVLTAAYFGAGKLAMLMALPPGYATAIWPAAGIALAALLQWGGRYWPAVMLGSFLVNAPLTLGRTSGATAITGSLAIAFAISIGAALQAALGREMICRRVGFPTPLSREGDVGKFLMFGGPVSCLVNASVGVGTLFVAGALEVPQLGFTWWTWWVGDTIGVLLLTPLVFIWTAEPRSVWRARRRAVAVPLVVCATLVISVFVYASRQDERRVQADFGLRTDRLADVIRRDLVAYEETIQSIRSYYEAAPEIDRASFRRLVTRALERHPGIRALGWAPIVDDAERDDYEAAARQDGLAGFRFMQLDAGRRTIVAPRRPRYVVAYFLEPISGNEPVMGLDISSDATRAETLHRALRTNAIAATPRIELIQERAHRAGIIAYLPVYRALGTQRHLRGYAIGVFRMSSVLAASLAGLDQRGVDLQLVDVSAPVPSVLCGFRSGQARSFQIAGDIQARSEVMFGGRHWMLHFAPSPEYIFLHRSWYAWAVLALGLLFTSLLGAFLLVVTGRAAAVEQQVAEQTLALSQRERQLRQVIYSAHDAFVAVDARGGVLEWNPAAEQIFGWRQSEMLGRNWLETLISAPFRPAIDAARRHLLVTKDDRTSAELMEAEATRRDGQSFPAELALSPIESAEQSWQFAVFVRDVSAKRENDRRILASLREKEVLLKEVHHRVKNNLQVISSLLSLQAQHTQDLSARSLFADSQSRVQSIALVHEALYRSKDLARIRLDEYARSLVERLFHVQNASARHIHAALDLHAVELSVGQAIPCGLIISELVTNALKYAFPDGRRGTVDISLQQRPEASVELAVGDDGVGLPPDMNPRATTSLGLDLVFTFAEQLAAEVEIQREGGTRFRFRFHREA